MTKQEARVALQERKFPYACCIKAKLLKCVCTWSYKCPDHGITKHIKE